ncbi:MAG TPA: DUF2239 family protein [Polyangiaceae bacterium]|jgi:hypothetical protein|nr:DUF2239 family protein [Polyangiaceae bacterium]
MDSPKTYSAFVGERQIAAGDLRSLLGAVKAHLDKARDPRVLIFEDQTGQQLDFDFSGSIAEVLERAIPAVPERAGPGRPKLGVVSREVSLLPRHWEWLENEAQGISATLRRLVDEAKKKHPGEQQARKTREAVNRFLTAMAGNLENYEEATRALFARDDARFAELIRGWPRDIRRHALSRLERTEEA